MTYALGVTIFAVGILFSVCLHEAGHLLTAKRFGMKATQYFAGFGPTLWSFRRGETEYGVKAIPAGGFVKIVGMTPLEELDPADNDRAFWRYPLWQRTIVLVAGSATHFALALVIFYFAAITTGLPNTAL
jgi:RIP metalloprotease RseP